MLGSSLNFDPQLVEGLPPFKFTWKLRGVSCRLSQWVDCVRVSPAKNARSNPRKAWNLKVQRLFGGADRGTDRSGPEDGV
jgi:hypothetical protein